MDSKPDSLLLRGNSAVTLNDRFSLLSQSSMKSNSSSSSSSVVLLVKRPMPSALALQVKRRGARSSVWTRLGWRHMTLRPAARCSLWSFRKKYRWRGGFSSAHKRRGHLLSGLSQRRRLKRRTGRKLTAGRVNLKGGGVSACRGRGLSRKEKVPTRKQLDAELDEYWSRSRRRLDQQLEDYMSQSRTRLDAELDEYMSMPGEALY
ncbi:uncharacterized protein LOC121906387 [Scomber scombrus]|uniref:Uncharacterized protein LOC121906387 n=1 Tax=Scomber scombrus TaxID=13677 RepID=A0AAV1QGA4_SCOSC